MNPWQHYPWISSPKQILDGIRPEVQGTMQHYRSIDLNPSAYNLYRLVKTSGADSGWKSVVRLVELKQEYLKVYPIPASETIGIKMFGNYDELETSDIQIFDQQGLNVLVDIKILRFDEHYIEMDISEIKAGVYFIKINDSYTKFIKL